MPILFVPTPIGLVRLSELDGVLTALSFCDRADGTEEETALLCRARRQLLEYFARERTVFDLPLAPCADGFSARVRDAVCAIPYGETRTYAQIAAQAGSPHAYRAVGNANNKNPLLIFVPCHRVVGASGRLVGYSGGLWRKEFLVRLEGK